MPTLDSLSFLLGFLDEYQGHRYEPGGEVIEYFYPAEGRQADSFRECLVAFAEERGISALIRSETLESGHIVVSCRELAFLISESYRVRRRRLVYSTDGDQEEPHVSGELYELLISEEVFGHADIREKISFLAGAYVRFGQDNTYVFANADHKVRLTMSLLKDVGCTIVSLSTNPDDYIPRISTISFVPSAEFATWLEHVKRHYA